MSDSYRTLITVTGIITSPAQTLATAPVARFCVFESFGKTELPLLAMSSVMLKLVVPSFLACLFATACRSACKGVKYKAEPKPVRMADGVAPRQRPARGFGEASMERTTAESEDDRDCCTRVLSKSAGCKRIEGQSPEVSPATK